MRLSLALPAAALLCDETWAFFMRNWGNEGFCSELIHVLPLPRIAFRIPWRCGATAVELAAQEVWKSAPVTSDPRAQWAAGEGVVVSIEGLPDPDPVKGIEPRLHGEIHLGWTLGGDTRDCAERTAGLRILSVPPEKEEETDSPEQRLENLVGSAGGPTLRALELPPERDEVPTKLTFERVTSLRPPPAREAVTKVVELKAATRKLQRDDAVVRAAKQRCAEERKGGKKAPRECEGL